MKPQSKSNQVNQVETHENIPDIKMQCIIKFYASFQLLEAKKIHCEDNRNYQRKAANSPRNTKITPRNVKVEKFKKTKSKMQMNSPMCFNLSTSKPENSEKVYQNKETSLGNKYHENVLMKS